MRFLKCRFLPPKKVLVLDCDNTLWGGVVGEVGPDNIELDPYEYPGIAYYRFQSEVLSVAAKGFLICLCSKNDEAAVMEVLEKHPHCLLRQNHIAAHRINWADKATNLKEIALELNLGLDSMVFVDDSSAECELIRTQFPEVTVIQVPAKIYEYPGILNSSNLFDKLSVGNAGQGPRPVLSSRDGPSRIANPKCETPKRILRDLKMKAGDRRVQKGDLGRVAQLCQRTNQFNLTSKRYTESDLAGFLEDPEIKMFVLQAEDRFGSMGQSGLIIFRKAGNAAEVDTFLMSCRIIGRKFDHALFCRGLEMAREAWPVDEVRASYAPTPKNSIVAGLWRDYGLAPLSAENGERDTDAGSLI